MFFAYVLLDLEHDVDIERVVGHDGIVRDVDILVRDDTCCPTVLVVLCPAPAIAFEDDPVEREVHLPGRDDGVGDDFVDDNGDFRRFSATGP